MDAFVVTPPGVESLTEAELTALGAPPSTGSRGGLSVETSLEGLYRAALNLRTASRILVRVAEFKARDFHALERYARRLDWDPFVPPGGVVELAVSTRKSRLYHAGAVEQRLSDAARAAGRAVSEPGDPDPDAQRIVVRLVRDRCTVSVDASGEHLHRRGYRLATARAPLRENLAAAALMAARWDPDTPLVDPMCGSGTLPIEAALMARRRAPGLGRRFAFEGWPSHDASTWERVRAEALARARPAAAGPILGSDRDVGAIDAARANAERAGVLADIRFRVGALSRAEPAGESGGLLVANPPYGRRVGGGRDLRDLYAALGNVARRRFGGWRLAVIATDPALVGQIGTALDPVLRTGHGGLSLGVWVGPVG